MSSTRSTPGAERIVAHLVNNLDRDRFRPMIICLDRSGAAARWLTRDDVPIIWSFASGPVTASASLGSWPRQFASIE